MDIDRTLESLPCDGSSHFVITGDCLECDYFDFCSKLIEEQNVNGQCSPYTG